MTGISAVLAAVRAQAVETLFIDPARVVDATVWAGAEPAQLALTRDELGDLGVEATHQLAAVAALVRAATCTDAALVRLTTRTPCWVATDSTTGPIPRSPRFWVAIPCPTV